MCSLVNIPCLECPFEIRTSPHESECQRILIEWWKSMGLVTSDEDLKHLLGIYGTELACRTIPDAPLEILVFMAKFNSLGIYYDDHIDGNVGQVNTESLFDMASRMMQTVNGVEVEPKNVIEGAILDLYQTGFKYFGHRMDHFKRKLRYYFRSMRWEMNAKKRHRIPEIGEYMGVREITLIYEINLDLYQTVAGIDPPNDVIGQSPINNLYFLTGRIVYILNDLCSMKKELEAKSVTNLIPVLMKGRKYSDWQSAVDEAVLMLEESVEAFNVWEKMVAWKSFGPEIDEQVAQYITLLKDYICGMYFLHENNHRYDMRAPLRKEDLDQWLK